MEVHEVAPGLWYWTAPHPAWTPAENWPEDVLCVYYEAEDAVVLVDPLVPRDEEERFWRALDRDVERLGRPVRVLLTSSWHERDTARVVERYGAAVGGEVAGIETLVAAGKEGDRLFFVREHRTLVAGDVFSGTGGRFHVFVGDDDPDPEAFLEWLPRLFELPVERVLIGHGPPVLADGAAAIREAVTRARSPQGHPTPVREALYRGDRAAAEAAATYPLDVFDAAALGRVERLRQVLDAAPELVHALSEDGFTALHLACFSGGAEAVRLLVERGAPLERLAESSFARVRPLGTAVFARDVECARVLLEAGADPNGAGEGGVMPLEAARQNGDEAMERLLLERGAS